MTPAVSTLTIRFSTADRATYRVDLEGPDVGERHGPFAPPYTAATWQAIMLALEPGFVLSQADKTIQAALKPLGDIAVLPRKAGEALANALLADEEVRLGFAVALGRAEAMRRPLPVEMRFGAGCDALAALPWELLHYRDRFLLADTSIALSRYPEGAIPPTPALGELPLRVLLVLSEPVGASPIFPERAREELLHGLRSLDEAGAVVVDLLRPPTFSTLVEAVTNGGYHMLVFYGHGGYDPEYGRPAAVRGRVRRAGADQGERAGRRAAQHRCAPGAVGRVPVGHYRRPVRYGKPDRSQHLERHRPGAGAGGCPAGHRHAGLDARRRRAGVHPPVRPVAGGRQAGDRGGRRRAQADHPRRVRRDVVRARALRPAGGRLSGCSTRRAVCPRTPPTYAPR